MGLFNRKEERDRIRMKLDSYNQELRKVKSNHQADMNGMYARMRVIEQDVQRILDKISTKGTENQDLQEELMDIDHVGKRVAKKVIKKLESLEII